MRSDTCKKFEEEYHDCGSGTNAATIPAQYEMHDSVQEAKIPAERFDFHNAEGLQLAALLDRPAAGANGRAVCALLLLWQAQQGRTAHRQTA